MSSAHNQCDGGPMVGRCRTAGGCTCICVLNKGLMPLDNLSKMRYTKAIFWFLESQVCCIMSVYQSTHQTKKTNQQFLS